MRKRLIVLAGVIALASTVLASGAQSRVLRDSPQGITASGTVTLSGWSVGKVEEDLLKEAYVEHDAAKLLIAQIQDGEPSDEFYDSKVKVLQEEIEHHVEEEEKRMEGLFAQAKKAGLDMEALGEQMEQRKAELMAQTESGPLPKPELTTM